MQTPFLTGVLGAIFAGLTLAPTIAATEEKLRAEELVARHLEALGTREARAAAPSRIAEGPTHLKILVGGMASLSGRALLFSDRRTLRANLRFDAPSFGGESFSFADDRSEVGFVQPGRRSPLGDFLSVYDDPLREGLLGGVLSASGRSWTFPCASPG